MDIKKQIKKLIRDELDDQQLDKLFIEFLKAPEIFDYYLREEQKYKTKKQCMIPMKNKGVELQQ